MAAMGAGTALRLARTTLFAVVCVAVSGLGHALMSDRPLPLPPLLSVLVPVAAAGWLLAGRDRNAPVTVSAHVLGQLGLHAYFTASTAGAAHHAPRATPHASHAGPAGDVSHRMELLAAFDASVFTTGMAASHAVAGLVCGWWLWRGEMALARLGRCLALFVRTPLRTAWRLWSATLLDGVSPVRPRAHRRPRRRLQDLLARHVISRRGPPFPVPSL
ncbi:hypothetical protein J7F02_08595 [Streptomyces sp. ISL-112]|uniref:hypothetical protein n=1 Tax=unclassified Streptomyces TaxID=2593676 RepID=UPI001BE622A1|nr:MULTISPECIES: hypothetical protein [unclassified Streptomyces]MBT2425736.1 hypothetical protein [Streptomyces sp. ISL-112]MBT2460719.1 hypothetical protein [Streptomyces sp. ISL-63]